MTVTPGCDISDYQKIPDFVQVADSQRFVIMKLTEGVAWSSRVFSHNWRAARKAGLVRLAYHFARPSVASGNEEGMFFLGSLRVLGGPLRRGDGVCLDLEDDQVDADADLLAYALDWMETVEAVLGFPPILYSRRNYMEAHNLVGDSAPHLRLARSGLWLASYRDDDAWPEPPPPWSVVALWQHSSAGRVAGIAGDVDLDRFAGGVEQLRRYGRP